MLRRTHISWFNNSGGKDDLSKIIENFGKQTQKEIAKLLKNFDQHDIIEPLIQLGDTAL